MTNEEIAKINAENPLAHCRGRGCKEVWFFNSIYDRSYQWECQPCFNGDVRYRR